MNKDMKYDNLELPLTIERQLERYCVADKHFDRHETLWHTWHQNKSWIMQLLEGNALSFPMYSRHDESHAQTILHNIELILGEDRIALLSATDCFVILHTVYIHDIGMTITSDEREEIVSSEAFQRMVDMLEESGDSTLKRAVTALKQTRYEYDTDDRYEKYRQLYQDKLKVYYALLKLIAQARRSEHGEKSKQRMNKWVENPDRLGSGLSLAGIPQRIFFTIAECARLHTEPRLDAINELPQEDDGYVFDYMHPRFVSVLLQLGDLLDLDNDRFHPLALTNLDEYPKQSLWHYQKHLSIRKLHICPDSIEIAADCTSQEALRQVRKEADWLTDLLKHAGYYWSEIRPKDFPGALPVVSSVELRLNGKRIPQDLVTTQFNISQRKAFEILEGSNIYANRFTFLREFLQNALDATKLQYWKECISTAEFYNRIGSKKIFSPYDLECCVSTSHFPVKVAMEVCKQKEDERPTSITRQDIDDIDVISEKYVFGVMVRIKDFGIGISQDSIRKIAAVGTSIDKEKKEIREMPVWLKPTAEFGVGLQSAFLVTDTFSCYTYTRSSERYEITFGSGARSHYEGYINVRPLDKIPYDVAAGEGVPGQEKNETYGTCFEIFVPIDKKLLHEDAPNSWNGEDVFSEGYERYRPIRHAAELMSQMALYLDKLVGDTSLFPVQLELTKIIGDFIRIPVDTNDRNRIRSIRLEYKENNEKRRNQ